MYQPRLDEDYAIIMGHIPSPAEVTERYRVDEVETDVKVLCIYIFSAQVRYTDEMTDHLKTLTPLTPTLLLLQGPNTDR